MSYNPEYYQQNKERIKANHKRYREKCKQEGKPVQKYNPEYYQQNKERINERTRKYTEEHKDTVQAKQKEYREKHKERIKTRTKKRYQICRERYDAYMLDKCCERCGTTDVRVLVWHHTNPLNKDKAVVKLLTCKWERVLAEIAKCICVCHNCHHIIHNYE